MADGTAEGAERSCFPGRRSSSVEETEILPSPSSLPLPRDMTAGIAKDWLVCPLRLFFMATCIADELDVEPEAPSLEGNEGAENPVWDISLSGILRSTSTSA